MAFSRFYYCIYKYSLHQVSSIWKKRVERELVEREPVERETVATLDKTHKYLECSAYWSAWYALEQLIVIHMLARGVLVIDNLTGKYWYFYYQRLAGLAQAGLLGLLQMNGPNHPASNLMPQKTHFSTDFLM